MSDLYDLDEAWIESTEGDAVLAPWMNATTSPDLNRSGEDRQCALCLAPVP